MLMSTKNLNKFIDVFSNKNHFKNTIDITISNNALAL